MRPGAGKKKQQKQAPPQNTYCSLCASVAKWTAIGCGIFLLMLYCGVFTRLGCFKWMDTATNADGNTHLKGIAPWVHHGDPWGFELDDLKDGELKGRTIIVTGANVGLGLSSSVALASKGAEVVMACRSRAKCTKAALLVKERVKGLKGAGTAKEMILDLSSFTSIKNFADEFLKNYDSLHSLMLNAGIMRVPFALTEQGIESQIGVNHFGHFYLTKLLLPILRKTGTPSLPATIVPVSSSAHFRTYPHGISLTLKELNDEEKYEEGNAYGQSKLANVLFMLELSEREKDNNILVNSIHPGAVDTELARSIIDRVKEKAGFISSLVEPLLKSVSRSLLWDPDTAALTQVFAAVSPKLLENKTTGKYYHPIARETTPHVVFAGKQTLRKGLWALSEVVVKKFEGGK